jgi:molecular chaperone HtpG
MSAPDASAAPPCPPQALEFRAEVQQLLHILAHSLYTHQEIFLRELISNASDALNRLQFEMLTDRDVLDPEVELAIHLAVDREAGLLTVSDTGIGMTRQEMVENLGTIAHSGAAAFLRSIQDQHRAPDDIIGQFGVGFYSVFMVAEQVTVTSRSYRPNESAWTWTSRGEATYTLTPAERAGRGTTVQVKLKPDAAEFTDPWRLRQIVQTHSDYVSFPIYLDGQVINRQSAVWRQAPQTVTAEQYAEFYTHLTRDSARPLLQLHVVTDAPVNLRAILYVPSRREPAFPVARADHGLRLYSRKVLIQENCKDLLPNYLRFVVGVVDSEDLPLNISRETIQNNPVLRQIKRALSHRLLKQLLALSEEKPEAYRVFWREFGTFVKEGIATAESADQETLPNLVLCHSTRAEGDADWVSFKAYLARIAPGQKAIYYILGDTLKSAARSPHLDYFRAHALEVLYLLDPLDSFMTVTLKEYAGKPLQNVDDASLELPVTAAPEAPAPPSLPADELERLIQRARQQLGDRVAGVRPSRRLIDSPCCLMSAETGPERDLQRVRRLLEQAYEVPSKILEINPGHSLIRDLAHLLAATPDDPLIGVAIEQLFDNASLLDGLLPSPADMTPRIQQLMEAAISARLGAASSGKKDPD